MFQVISDLVLAIKSYDVFLKDIKIIPDPALVRLYLMKYRKDQKNYNLILSEIDVNFSICSSCHVGEVRCPNRKKVTLRNFVPGACVMVADADRRAGKGEGAIHKLDAITDRKTQKFRGFYKLESKRKIKNSLR